MPRDRIWESPARAYGKSDIMDHKHNLGLDPAAHGMGAPKGSNGDRLGGICASNEHLHPNHIGNSGLRIKAHLASCDFRKGPISP